MKKTRQLFLFVAFAVSFVANIAYAHNDTIIMTDHGKSDWKIVLPDDATEVDQTAAAELQLHMEQMTKVKLPIVSEKAVSDGSQSLILIGNTNRTCDFLNKFVPNKTFAFDEIYIKMTPNVLILTGHERRGSLYAVYTFLEEIGGCRWWTAECSTIPEKTRFSVPADFYVSYAPKIISRQPYHRLADPGIYSARNKGNGWIPKEYGGSVKITPSVHSFYKWIPPEKYFRDHPDWFPEIGGKRVVGIPQWSLPNESQKKFMAQLPKSQIYSSGTQLCLTSDEMRKELTNNVLHELRNNPEIKIVDISQQDWSGFCTCPKCKAIDDHEESHSGSLVHFLNKVAADIEKEFPDVLVETLAYQYTRKPPKHVKVRHNVIIRLCSIECSFVRPLDHPQNEAFASDIEGWSSISKNLFIWDYVTNYCALVGPFPNYRTLAPNVRYFVKHGATGILAEGEGDDFPELRNWTLSRLMWNPDLDEEKLFEEFCDGYYGKEVTPLLKRYRDLISDAGENSGKKLPCFCIPETQWLDIKSLTEATNAMNTAVETVRKIYGENSPQFQHITKTKLSIDWVWLRYYRFYRAAAAKANLPYAGPQDPIAAWNEFTRECRRFKITTLASRSRSPVTRPGIDIFDIYLDVLKNSEFIPMKDLPDFCNKLSPDRVFVFDDGIFRNGNSAAERVNDPAAANGLATKMSTKVAWTVSFSPYVAGRFRTYISFRSDTAAKDVPAIEFGAYDPENKKKLFSKIVNANELEEKKYKWIDFGVVNFTEPAYFYFSRLKQQEIPHVYVDRVILVKEEK